MKEKSQRLVCNREKGELMGFMGFTLAKDLGEKAAKIALAIGESDEAVVIPDSSDQVLVRAGSRAYRERMETKGVFMIPVELRTLVNGVEKQELFCVCTK
ncbi:MAG: hypothetical protein WCN95_13030 [bacterium]